MIDGRVSLYKADIVEDPEVMFRLFGLVGAHNLKLAAETENSVEAALPQIKKWVSTTPDLWDHFRKILLLPYAAASLRAMHRLGFLVLMFPEFKLIESLVIRDYYHRYTVNKHSLVTIETLHNLSKAGGGLSGRFQDILSAWNMPNCSIWR